MSLFEELKRGPGGPARIADYLRWIALVVLVAVALVFAVIMGILVVAGDSAAGVIENLLHHVYIHYGLIPVLVLLLVTAAAVVAFALQLAMTFIVYYRAYARKRGDEDGGSERPGLFAVSEAKTGWSRGYYQGVVLILTNAVLAVLLIAGIVYALGYVGIDVAEQPEFCTMCHEVMDKPYESYAASTHAGIACGACHNDPGLKGFIKGEVIAPMKEGWLQAAGEYHLDKHGHLFPSAVPINNKSCLAGECHKEERLRTETFRFGPYQFRHEKHLELKHGGSPLTCDACHAYDKKVHMKVDNRVCGLCHFSPLSEKFAGREAKCEGCHAERPKLKDKDSELMHREVVDFRKQPCGECHEARKAGLALQPTACGKMCHHRHGREEMSAEGRDIHKIHKDAACMHCHAKAKHEISSAKFESAPMDGFGKPFTHSVHEGEGCTRCHGEKGGHFALTLSGRADCSACHHEGVDDPETCGDCHDKQDEFFKGKEKFGFEETPSAKSEMEMGCDSCHGDVQKYEPIQTRKSCTAECHDVDDPDYDYKKLVEKGRKALKSAMFELNAAKTGLASALRKGVKPEQLAGAQKAVSEARKMLDFLKTDGSFGLHNPGLFEEYIGKIEGLLEQAKKLMEKPGEGEK